MQHFLVVSGYDWRTVAVIVAVVGTFGDLMESALKRNQKLKDSGTLLPGHGGILDRFDGFLFVMPVLVVYRYFF
jgi:phosphatidate cytidylyltransferase